MGIGSEGQFAPMRLSCEGSFLACSFFGVEPSMAAEGIAARRVKL